VLSPLPTATAKPSKYQHKTQTPRGVRFTPPRYTRPISGPRVSSAAWYRLGCLLRGTTRPRLCTPVACTSQVLVYLLRAPPTGGTHSASRALRICTGQPVSQLETQGGQPPPRRSRSAFPQHRARARQRRGIAHNSLFCKELTRKGRSGDRDWTRENIPCHARLKARFNHVPIVFTGMTAAHSQFTNFLHWKSIASQERSQAVQTKLGPGPTHPSEQVIRDKRSHQVTGHPAPPSTECR
jgi:hypothetical protein